jgi:uncharacterized OsmC-like protein
MLKLTAAEIKELYGRKARAMRRRPSFGRGSGHARIHLGDGLRCEIDDDDRKTSVDQPESSGGSGTAPHPGQLMRASVGACLAMGYRLWGAREDVVIDAVDVEITCEFDARGQMGVSSEVAVGWQRVLFDVVITSPAPAEAVRTVVEIADRLSPMLANLAPSIDRVHRLTIVPSAPSAGPQIPSDRGERQSS